MSFVSYCKFIEVDFSLALISNIFRIFSVISINLVWLGATNAATLLITLWVNDATFDEDESSLKGLKLT